jgi:hypothetical protein
VDVELAEVVGPGEITGRCRCGRLGFLRAEPYQAKILQTRRTPRALSVGVRLKTYKKKGERVEGFELYVLCIARRRYSASMESLEDSV